MPPESECSQVRRPEAGKVEVPPIITWGKQDLQGVGTGSERGKNSFTTWRFRYEKPGRQTMGKSQQAGLRQLRKDQVYDR